MTWINFNTLYLFPLLCVAVLSCCGHQTPTPPTAMIEIAGRGDGISARQPLYRIKAPKTWEFSQPSLNDSLLDTMLPLCEFAIHENGETIRIAIHSFPTDKIEERIPPQAQISRWKQQFEDLNFASISTIPQAFNGFTGALFEGTGVLKGEPAMMLGWSLQIGLEHYQHLNHPGYKQMRSDVTIKAVGPAELMNSYRSSIIAFARSFELINEIP